VAAGATELENEFGSTVTLVEVELAAAVLTWQMP